MDKASRIMDKTAMAAATNLKSIRIVTIGMIGTTIKVEAANIHIIRTSIIRTITISRETRYRRVPRRATKCTTTTTISVAVASIPTIKARPTETRTNPPQTSDTTIATRNRSQMIPITIKWEVVRCLATRIIKGAIREDLVCIRPMIRSSHTTNTMVGKWAACSKTKASKAVRWADSSETISLTTKCKNSSKKVE